MKAAQGESPSLLSELDATFEWATEHYKQVGQSPDILLSRMHACGICNES